MTRADIYSERERRLMEAAERHEASGVRLFKRCGHGKLYDDPCAQCDMIWHEQCLRDHQEMAAHHQRKLDELKGK